VTPEEAVNKALETKPLYVRLLKRKDKRQMALAVLREEALKHLPKASLSEETLSEVETLLERAASGSA
jgi:hypothetical protein